MEPAVAHALATIIRTGTYWRNGWRQENADKCEWTFGVPLVTLSDGTNWKLQGLWSNCAYNSGAGSKSVFLVVSLVATIGTPAAQKFGKGVSEVA